MQDCRRCYRTIKLKAVLLIATLTMSCTVLKSQTEKYIQVLTGDIKKGDTCVVLDDKFRDAEKWATVEKHLTVNNLVTFEIRYDTSANYFNRNFSCTLQVDIEYQKADGEQQVLKNISLQVNYDTLPGSTHQGIAYYKFTGGHRVKITVSKIKSQQWDNKLPPVFRIRNEIFIQRAYALNLHDPALAVLSYSGNESAPSSVTTQLGSRISGTRVADLPGQQVTISWDGYNPAFPQYDFEWTFYDDSSLVGSSVNRDDFSFSQQALEAVFKNNSSRITIGLPFYQLNIIYNKGWVFHRVRGIRYDATTGDRTEGAWSYAGSYQHNGNAYGLLRSQGHEEDLNWQYNVSFSEEGKRREIVDYFDGNLRKRQSVTLNNDYTGSRALVQENIPDALGRMAVNILPAPTDETSIHYFRDFNKSAVSDLPYSYSDFETPGSCLSVPSAMSNHSGAARYYSNFNQLKGDNSNAFYFTKYIPDAGGYPFAVTGFTPDNTGRIRFRAGVGPVLQPGKPPAEDHTTRYYYGKPQQEELDRLFGNEAGDASHYLKNMAIDANGQATVSYLNASGQTVATALSGLRPVNLQPLPNYQLKNTALITALGSKNDMVRDPAHLSLTYSSTFLAAAPGSFTLQYDFTPRSLQVLYGVENEKICADCYYDLLIRVTDNCGNPIQSVNQEAIFTEKTTCEPAPTRQKGTLPVNIEQPGEYNISYQLKLSRKAIEYYSDQFLVQNTSLAKESDFRRSYLHKIDISGCFNDCKTCLAALGAEADFMLHMTGILQHDNNIISNVEDSAWIKNLYKQLLDECNLLQQGCGQTESPCELQTLQLKEDLTPGGQYMLYDPTTNKFIERDINVFLKNRNALTTPVTINGVSKPFNQLSEVEIIANWQDDWATMLLAWHPENKNNCFIDACALNAESDMYDNRFLNTDDARQAHTQFYWFGDDYRSVINNDPWFKPGAGGATKKVGFLSLLNNYRNTGLDIMSFVRWNVYCQDKASGNYTAQPGKCARTAACNREVDEWALFKVLYYSAKEEIKEKEAACDVSDLFTDPLAAMLQVTNPSAVMEGDCAALSLFGISQRNGGIAIQYNGVQKIAREVTVRYFAVSANGQVDNNAGGSMLFPASTAPGTIQMTAGNANLLYSIDFARCDLAHPYYTKTRRNYNGVTLASVGTQVQNKPREELNQNAGFAITRECNESCEQAADGWMQQLAGCNLEFSSTEYTALREGLIAVCKSSCRVNVQDHPFGASTTNIATEHGDKTFKDVLLRVLGSLRFSAICNDLLLSFPPAIDALPLYTNEQVRTLRDCAYDKLKSWKSIYQQSRGYSSLADYIKSNIDSFFSLTDEEITSLLVAYEQNCVTPRAILLPASLSCNASQPKTCLSCTELQDEALNFMTEYNYVSSDTTGYYELLARFVNRKYGFNLSSVDIYTGLQQCTADTAVVSKDTIDCANILSAYKHFQQLIPVCTVCNPNGLKADSLYKTQLTHWLNTETGHQLSFDYYSKLATSCNIAFDYPAKHLTTCDTETIAPTSAPRLINCCMPFAELEQFKQVFADSIDARLLALYFSLLRVQGSPPINLPVANYTWPYDSILYYFHNFRIAGAYHITVGPDSITSYTPDYSSDCQSLTLNFKTGQGAGNAPLYVLCNKPMEPTLAVDENNCINQQISVAMSNSHSDYLEYLEKMQRDYRDAYYTKCLSITPRLTLEAVYNQPQEYQYTLYYYDQSGNLVKTIPPAGVQPIDEETDGAARMERVKNARLADKDYCYEYSDAPAMNGTAQITIADRPEIHQNAGPFTVEAFVKFDNPALTQTILTKQSVNSLDNKTDGYKIYINNGRLMVDMAAHGSERWMQTLSKLVQYPWPAPYANQPPVTIRSKVQVPVPRALYRSLTARVTSNFSTLVGSGQWYHIAIQNTGNWSNPVRVYINGSLANLDLEANVYDYTPSGPPELLAADIAAGTTMLDFSYSATTVPLNLNNGNAANLVIGAETSGLLGSIKQVRLYNRALPVTEIRSNAFSTCLVPQSEGSLVVWLPLNREEKGGSSTDRVNQLSTINTRTVFSEAYQPVYPTHRLATRYYYNSLNTVIRQSTPDGGSTSFWYDLPGRLVASQNAEQKTSTRGETNNRYSYIKYDALGRITETGEKTGATSMTAAIAKTDPVIVNSSINNWLKAGTDMQLVQTIYDQPNKTIVTDNSITGNQNMYNTSRKRVVATIYRGTTGDPADYNNATHFQYDICGNIKRLWQENKKSVTGSPVNMLRDFQYDYDLASGKVNYIIYQKDKGDQFIYKYDYDPDNRLLRAYSGRDMNTLQLDAG
ncbi:MAG: hypothetical protein ABI813_15430, partial [Bacteroidota bacterium]